MIETVTASMKTKAVTHLLPVRFPSGTLYSVGDLPVSKFSLNKARVDGGRLKILTNDVQSPPPGSYSTFFRGAPASSGDTAVFRGPDARYYLAALKAGKVTPLKEGFGREFFYCRFTGFTPGEQYLAYNWWVQPQRQRPRLPWPTGAATARGGSGIYDLKSHQTWEREEALLAVWSRSGQHLVFVRNSPEGKYLYFRKDVRRLSDPSAESITLEQAVQLVGPWYRPLLSYSNKEGFSTYQGEDLDGNQIAPRNRGVVLINTRNTYWAEPMPQFVKWTIQYLDASGRSPLYKPTPALYPILSWSPDGERIYGITGTSTLENLSDDVGDEYKALICFWVRSGKYARIPLPKVFGASIAYRED